MLMDGYDGSNFHSSKEVDEKFRMAQDIASLKNRRSASDAKLDILESVIKNANNSKIKHVNIDFSNDDNLETSKMTITIE